MASILKLALAASAILGLASSLPTEVESRQTFVPGTLNNTREFYIQMVVTDGPRTYEGWTST